MRLSLWRMFSNFYFNECFSFTYLLSVCSVLSTLSLIPWRQGLSQNPNPGNSPVSAVHNSVTGVHSHTPL